jgi:quinol monooxygenase YgiN
MKLFIFARFHAREGRESDLAAAIEDVVGASRTEPGCVSISAFQATRDGRLFFIHSCWRDEAAFEVHAQMPHTQRFLERAEEAIDHPLDITRTRSTAG